MKRTRSFVVGIAAITGLVFAVPGGLGAAVAKPAPPPTLTYVDYMVPGSASTSVTGYNLGGVAAGTYIDATGSHGFVDTDIVDAAITVIDAPEGSAGAAVTSINDAGTSTGTYWTGTVQHGFLRAPDGAMTVIDDPAAPTEGDLVGTVASQVSTIGVVVGYSFTIDLDGITYFDGTTGPRTISHGFVWKDGAFTAFDAPDVFVDPAFNTGTQVLGINKKGAKVGTYTVWAGDNGSNLGFMVIGGSFKAIVEPTVPTNWCGSTAPMAINDAGVIVGSAGNGCSGEHPFGFTYSKGQFSQVTSSNPVITNINGVSSINADGELSGSWSTPVPDVGYDPDDPVRGFIAHR